MKVKELIKILEKLPQNKEVVLEREPDYDYEAIPVIGASLGPIKVGEYLCHGSDDKCRCCEPDGYCIYDDDSIMDVIEEHVILKLNEPYKKIENEYEERKYYWYDKEYEE